MKEDHSETKKQSSEETSGLCKNIVRMGNEEPLKLIIDKIPGLLAYVNKDQYYVYVNQAYADWYCLSKDEMIGKKVKDVLNEESYRRAVKHIRSVLQGKEITYENVAYKNGELRTVKSSYIPHFNDHGKVIAFLAMVEDITDRKQAEKALQDSEKRYRDLVNHAGEAIVVVSEGMIVFVNPKASEISGYSREELLSKSFIEFIHPDDQNGAIYRNQKRLTGKKIPFIQTIRIVDKTGTIKWVRTDSIIIDWKGKPAYLNLINDITERKLTEEALRESEERYHAIFKGAADSIVLIDPDTGAVVEFNDRAHKSLGYTRKEFKELRISDFEIIESDEMILEHLKKCIREGAVTFETKHKTKKGEIRDILVSASSISIKGRCIVQGIWRDITKRKRTEEALIYRSEFERRVTSISIFLANLPLEKIDIGISQVLRSIGEFTRVDRSYIFLFNDDRTSMSNTHEWCVEGITPQIEQIQNIPVSSYQWSINRIKKSKTIHVPRVADLPVEADPEKLEFQRERIQSLIMVPMVYTGHVVGFLGFDSVQEEKFWPKDIIALLRIVGELIANALERKQSEKALRESERKYRELVDLLPQVVFEMDLKGNITFVNQHGLEIFGYKKKDFKLGVNIKQLFPPDEYKRVIDSMQKISKGEIESGNEYVAIKKDGNEINVIVFSVPIFSDGQHKGWRGTVIDITDRRRAETAIQESEEKFRTLAEQSPNMIFINKERRVVYANKKCEEITGYTREELYSPQFSFINLIAPEHHDFIRANYKQHLSGNEVQPYEYLILTKNGDRIDAIISTKLMDYEGGKAILGIVTDITERKLTEEALRESQARLELTLDSVGIGLWDHEIETNKVIRSRHWAEMLGYQPDEIGDNLEVWKKLIHPEDLPLVEETVKKHKIGEIPFIKVEHRLRTKDNDWKWILNWGKIIEYDENDQPARALGTHIDISDRKQAEEEIKRANREWRSIFQAVGHPMVVLDPNYNVLAANQAVLEKTGKSEQQLIGKKCYHIFHGTNRDQPEDQCPLQAFIQAGYIETSEMEMQSFGGTYLVSCTPVFNDTGTLEKIIHIATDITERKQAESAVIESEKQFRSIFENAVMGFYRTTPNGHILMANPALIHMLGYTTFEELEKRNLEKDGYEPNYPRKTFKSRLKREKQIAGLESAWIKRDGTVLYVSENAKAIFDDRGEMKYYEGTIEDITERKKAEKLIQQSLEEKEALLKEIHHRVKNNLQVIISLLNLQAGQVQDSATEQAFKESNRRIRSMALVHEKLYQSENFSTINFKEYVEGMAQELFGAYKVTQNVKLKLDIDKTSLGVSEAIPCGLILNELISNALKYAFPKNREGWIHVEFHQMKSGQYELIVKDNGIGISPNINFENTESLGLLLVKILTDQIDGNVDMARKNGTIFNIRFKGQK